MHAYRFRVLAEDQDEFIRDIDILTNQTFEDLHQAFTEMFNLNNDELASFYICDHKWRRLKELTLIDMKHEEELEDIEDEDLYRTKIRLPVFVMNQVKIKDMIDDPHQRIIYEYDFLNPVILFIEMIKINKAESDQKYPLVVRSEGDFVRTPLRRTYAIEDVNEDLLTTEDDLLDDTFEVDSDDVTVEEPPMW